MVSRPSPCYLEDRSFRHGTSQSEMDDKEDLRRRLAALVSEHRDLDDVIARLSERRPVDELQVRRLKKRKLTLKDMIAKLESELLPDIIA